MNVPTKCDLYGIYRYLKPNEIKPENEQKEELIPENEPETRFVPLAGEEIKSSLDILGDMGKAMVEGGHGTNEPASGVAKSGEPPRGGDEIWNHYQNLKRSFVTEIERYLSGNSGIDPVVHHRLIVSIANAMNDDLNELAEMNYVPKVIQSIHMSAYDIERQFIVSSLETLNSNGRGGVAGEVKSPNEVNEPDGEKVSGNTTKSEENISPRNGDVTYEEVLTEAQNLNKELWSSVSQFLEEYGFNNSIDFSNIGDNPDPNDPRFTVLKELGERLTKEEWLIIKDMVDELIEMLSKAHELNGFSMDGEENQLKHPVQYGIIANIIDPLRYLYE